MLALMGDELYWKECQSWSGNEILFNANTACLDAHVTDTWNQMVATNSNSCLDAQTLEYYILTSSTIMQCCTRMKI
jgi:hypothetical protein